MFHWIDGVRLPAGAAVQECYWVDGDWVRANVSAEHILPLMRRFVEREAAEADGFCLFLETPVNIRDEPPAVGLTEDGFEIREAPSHVDVYYLDAVPRRYLESIFDKFGDYLVHDGLSHFGVLARSGREVGKYKYNVVEACARDGTAPLRALFEEAGIPESGQLVTAWDFFSYDAPGECERFVKDGHDIYDVVEALKTVGLYRAEQREG